MLPDLAVSERALETNGCGLNGADGTLSLTDKTNGQTYQRLLTFEDTADIGDGWNWGSGNQRAGLVLRQSHFGGHHASRTVQSLFARPNSDGCAGNSTLSICSAQNL